ncbi:hypothetical protein XH99_10845 [Bradyrhizobium nanningense]|uniref:Uncharacterized protein n=1 Tax=Bradyrhizobium nanningense TaxID=1325118 RepID=A0A4Q0SAE0_9BRAD|nr:hypothetical protein XH99_10845 [Bradyrhizobium nanningense]
MHHIDAVADQCAFEPRLQLQCDLDEIERPAIFQEQEDMAERAELEEASRDAELLQVSNGFGSGEYPTISLSDLAAQSRSQSRSLSGCWKPPPTSSACSSIGEPQWSHGVTFFWATA